MKNRMKRFLSVMLVMMMVVGNVGMPALAEGEIPEAGEVVLEQTITRR